MSVTKRDDGKFLVVVNYRDWEGRRRQVRRIVDGKRAADTLETKITAERDKNELPEQRPPAEPENRPDVLTVADWITQWLELYREEHPSSRTPAMYTDVLNRYVVPVIGNVALTDLKANDIRDVFRSELMQSRAGRTRLHTYRVLFQALRAAYRDELIDSNPAERVKAPEPGSFEPHTITMAEGRKLLELSKGTEIGPVVSVLMHTGLRIGEALGLRWVDVDLDGAMIQVRQSKKVNAPVAYGPPKTKSSAASIPLVSGVVTLLEAHRDAQEAQYAELGIRPDHGLVFSDPLGRGMSHDFVTVRWQELRTRAGVPNARIHDLRHFTGTYLLNLGVDLKTVSAILRHSSPVITASIYTHTVPESMREGVNKLEAAIGGS